MSDKYKSVFTRMITAETITICTTNFAIGNSIATDGLAGTSDYRSVRLETASRKERHLR